MGSPSRAVLVLNTGSSSIKYALYRVGQSASCVFQGIMEGIGTSKSSITHRNIPRIQEIKIQDLDVDDHKGGLTKVIELLGLREGDTDIAAVGHRVVHGGETLTQPSLITDQVKKAIEHAAPLAPLHNPACLQGIVVAQELFHCPHVAVFDTAFHSTIPPHAYLYALPYRIYEELKIRRYGFHGTSYKFLLDRASDFLGKPKEELNVILCHLGAGASMAVVKQGVCIDTTMGVTPLEGLVMATRCGDVDPAVVGILADLKGMSVQEITAMMNKESGLYGICGDKDMRAIIKAADSGSWKHQLALKVFIQRIRRYLGAYLVQLEGKVDALVFSAGIGESSAKVRTLVCEGLDGLGIAVDEHFNKEGRMQSLHAIHKESSRIKILVIPTDEELSIAQQTMEVVVGLQKA